MASEAFSFRDYSRILRQNRNFRLLWFAQIVSELGDWIYALAVYSLLLQYTGKAESIALAFVMQVLPQVLTSPAAGVLNDRFSRKNIMIFADYARAIIVTAMLSVRSPDMIWFLYVLLFLETTMWAMFEPAHHAVIPNITDEKDMTPANTLSSMTWSLNFMIGFSIGGLIMAAFGREVVFIVNGLSFVLSASLIKKMNFVEPHTEGHPAWTWKSLFDFSPIASGIRYMRQDNRLFATMLCKAGLGLLGSNWVLLPIFGQRVYPLNTTWFGPEKAAVLGQSLLMGARGLGAVLGPVSISFFVGNSEKRMRHCILLGMLLACLGYVGLGLAPDMLLACLGVLIAHSGLAMIWVYSTTLLQMSTEDKFRGRVFSAEFSFAVTTMAASSAFAGYAVDHGMPVRQLSVINGLAMLVPALLWLVAQRLWKQPQPAKILPQQ